jgi:hypothetical protein
MLSIEIEPKLWRRNSLHPDPNQKFLLIQGEEINESTKQWNETVSTLAEYLYGTPHSKDSETFEIRNKSSALRSIQYNHDICKQHQQSNMRFGVQCTAGQTGYDTCHGNQDRRCCDQNIQSNNLKGAESIIELCSQFVRLMEQVIY